MSWKRHINVQNAVIKLMSTRQRTVRTTYHPRSFVPDCQTVQNIVVNCGVIGDVAPSFNSEVGRLCPRCGSADIKMWICIPVQNVERARIYWRKRLLDLRILLFILICINAYLFLRTDCQFA